MNKCPICGDIRFSRLNKASMNGHLSHCLKKQRNFEIGRHEETSSTLLYVSAETIDVPNSTGGPCPNVYSQERIKQNMLDWSRFKDKVIEKSRDSCTMRKS